MSATISMTASTSSLDVPTPPSGTARPSSADRLHIPMARLGRYTLLEPVGEGGMAEVFRARLDGPMGFQKTLAIKRIRDQVVRQDEEHVRALINEARIGGKLRHPNIVEVYDLGEDDGAYYIAMEFVEGVNLSDIMRCAREHRVRVPPAVLLDIGIQVCRGLAYAHKIAGDDGEPLDLVHRDLKPSNIMVSMGGVAKIMDFGIAKASSNLFDTTATGIAKGTPLYMSPEQLRGMRPLPSCSDLFSVGVLLTEMATGKLLFAGRTIPEIITRVLNQPLNDAIDEADQRVPGIKPVLERLLDRDVAARYQDANEVAIELGHLLEWQQKKHSTAEVAQAVAKGHFPGAQRMSTTAAAMRPIVDRDDAGSATRNLDGDPDHLIGNPSETLVGTWIRRQQRRRFLVILLIGALLGASAAVGSYVFRGTLGVTLAVDSAREALNQGDLAKAMQLWAGAVEENPGRVDARYGAVMLESWAGKDVAALESALEFAPEETPAEFARKYLAFGRVLRADGQYTEAFRNLKLALDAARRGRDEDGVPMAPDLLQEAAEIALILESPDAARSYQVELAQALPPGEAADLALAWSDAIAEGRGPLLGAELLWIDGRLDKAYGRLAQGFQVAKGSREGRQLDRLVWAYRALGDEKYGIADKILQDVGALTGESARRRAVGVARAAALAGQGQTSRARRELSAALKLATTAEQRATARLHVALALTRRGGDSSWAASLVEEAVVELQDVVPQPDKDPDVRLLLELQAGEKPSEAIDPFAARMRLAVDPRSGRFLPRGLARGGPTGSRLIAPAAFPRENISKDGLAAPFGPTYHPLDGTLLGWYYHPGR